MIFQKRKGAIRERKLCITQFMEPKINTREKMYLFENAVYVEKLDTWIEKLLIKLIFLV